MVNETIDGIVKRYLEVVVSEEIPVSAGVIYGSHARQQEDAWSDIDLLVISPRFDEPRRWKDVTHLWHIAARVDSRIEPIPVGQRQFEEDDSSAIIEIAHQEGHRISLAKQ